MTRDEYPFQRACRRTGSLNRQSRLAAERFQAPAWSATGNTRGTRRRLTVSVLVLVLLGVGFAPATAAASPSSSTEFEEVVTESTFIEDRYGSRLRTHLYYPALDGRKADGKFPVILLLLYQDADTEKFKTEAQGEPDQRFGQQGKLLYDWARRGYVAAVVNWSGTFNSEGSGSFYGRQAQLSGYDVVEWLGGVAPDGSPSPAAEWSTGRVGMYGESGNGYMQLLVAQHKPPHLATIVPAQTPDNLYSALYLGGMPTAAYSAVFNGFSAVTSTQACTFVPRDAAEVETAAECLERNGPSLRLLPRAAPVEYLQHPTYDEYWREIAANVREIDVPMWLMGSWRDVNGFPAGETRTYDKVASRHKLLDMGYGYHGAKAAGPGFDYIDDVLPWFNYWLKDQRAPEITRRLRSAPVRYYVGQEGVWKEAADWPIPGTQYSQLYLGPRASDNPLTDGSLVAAPPDPGSASDTYLYTPGQGRGGGFLLGQNVDEASRGCKGEAAPRDPHGVPSCRRDQRLEQDALTYISEPLTEDVQVTGPVSMKLWASTSARDTDFVVRLVDVWPDDELGAGESQSGFQNIVTSGWLKGTHRHGHTNPEPIPVGEPVPYEIQLDPTSYLFRKGHRFAVVVASGDSSTLPNRSPAVVDVHKGKLYPSQISLPIGSVARNQQKKGLGVTTRGDHRDDGQQPEARPRPAVDEIDAPAKESYVMGAAAAPLPATGTRGGLAGAGLATALWGLIWSGRRRHCRKAPPRSRAS